MNYLQFRRKKSPHPLKIKTHEQIQTDWSLDLGNKNERGVIKKYQDGSFSF